MRIHLVPDTDDRRTCAQCLNGCRPGPCLAVRRGELVAARTYDPDRKQLHRCIAYKPMPSERDQRTGRQRWPNLTFKLPTKEKNKK